MGVPEAAVDQHYFPVARQDDIGFAGEVVAVETKAIAKGVKETTDAQFGSSVLAADIRHDLTAFGLGEGVSHHGVSLKRGQWNGRRDKRNAAAGRCRSSRRRHTGRGPG